MKETLNIAQIKEKLGDIHKKFVEAKNMVSLKVEADKELKLVRVESKINVLVKTFREMGIIDNYAVQNPSNSLGTDSSVVCFVVKKNGFSNSVYIMTDGTNIVVKDSSFMIDFGNFSAYCQRFPVGDDVNTFDWIDFSQKLLDQIHTCVYNRERVNQLSIFGTN